MVEGLLDEAVGGDCAGVECIDFDEGKGAEKVQQGGGGLLEAQREGLAGKAHLQAHHPVGEGLGAVGKLTAGHNGAFGVEFDPIVEAIAEVQSDEQSVSSHVDESCFEVEVRDPGLDKPFLSNGN